ncbi:MAG: hypothetical protein NVSMB64_00160 [Candidatus Velthaea sp.]
MLGHRREDLDRKPIRVGVITSYEVNAAGHKFSCYKHATGQPIDPRDHERCARTAGMRESRKELWPILQAVAAGCFNLFV